MGAGRPHDHRDLADPEASQPMPEDHPAGPEPTTGLDLDRAELPNGRRRVGFVEEGDDASAGPPVGPDPPREEHDPAQAPTVQLPHRRLDAQGLGGQADRHG